MMLETVPGSALTTTEPTSRRAPTRLAVAAGLMIALHGVSAAQGVDPLKPEGVSIGMNAGEARDALHKAGFVKGHRDGAFEKKIGDGVILMEVVTFPRFFDPAKPVSKVFYHRKGLDVGEPAPDVVKKMNQTIGSEGQCSRRIDPDRAACVWRSPAKDSQVDAIELLYMSPTELRIQLTSGAGPARR